MASVDRVQYYSLVILTAIAITGALSYTKHVLVPFAFSLLLFGLISPAMFYIQEKFSFPRWLAIFTVFTSILVCCAGLMILIINSFGEFLKGADTYKALIVQTIENGQDFAARLGFQLNADELANEIKSLPLLRYLQGFSGGLFSILGNSVLILVFLLFLLLGAVNKPGSEMMQEIQIKVSKYLLTKMLVSLATAVSVWVVLGVFGVDLAFLFAVLTFLLNFIPSLGSILATLLPLPVILLQYGFGGTLVAVALLCFFIQFVIGNVIEPKFMGEHLDLHPVTLLMSLIFWGLVWGLPGMFLAVPITAILKIIFTRLPNLQVVSEIMAGRIFQLEKA